jgi:hypothetical protein
MGLAPALGLKFGSAMLAMRGMTLRPCERVRRDLLRRGRAGGGSLGRILEFVGSQGRVSACALEGFEGHTVAEFGDSDDGRVVLLDEFPET